MIIKESIDVARMLIERYDELEMLGPSMRVWIVDRIMELYHKIREAEECRVVYSFNWITDEEKEQLKSKFQYSINEARDLIDFIESELERTRKREESVAGGYLDFDVMNDMSTAEQKQYINDVMSR